MRTIKKKATSARILLPAILIASGLPAVTSCDKVPAGEQPGDTPIAFNSAVSTKAPVESENNMTEFAVWAAYNDMSGDPASMVMDGIRVYRSTPSGDGWTYDDIKLWRDGQWEFRALYPNPQSLNQDGNNILEADCYVQKTEEQSEKGVYIQYYDGSAADIDLMLAENSRQYPDGGAGAVQFTFSHILSKVSLAVKSEGNAEITVTDLKFSGMGVYGRYNYNDGSETSAEEWQDKWRIITHTVGEGDSMVDVPVGEFSLTQSVSIGPAQTVTVLENLLLIPQTIPESQVSIDVSWKYNGKAHSSSIFLPAAEWLKGSSYMYSLSIYADAELAVEVVPWNGNDLVVEW